MESFLTAIYNAVLSCVKKHKATSVFFLFLFIIGSPAIFTRSCSPGFNFSNTGQIGDTFAIMNPFIAIVAAVLTFIAFWTQYTANKDMLKNNDKQQEERQFYEMLKFYKDSVENLKMAVRLKEKNEDIIVNGQTAIRMLQIEFKNIYYMVYYIATEKGKKTLSEIDHNQVFLDAYNLFFKGSSFKKDKIIDEAVEIIKATRKEGEFDLANGYNEESLEGFSINPLKFGLGHVEQFDPYYRHLYHMVKSVVLSEKFNDDEKMKFLKILRAQMTSDEQILLLYNWWAGYGKKWECVDADQYFFSKYLMIHNIFLSDCVFKANDIFDMFPHASEEEKKKMFEHIEYQPQT